MFAFAIFSMALIFSCRNIVNRVKKPVWVNMPYSINKGVYDSNNILTFATKRDEYALVDSVSNVGYNDKFIIVISHKRQMGNIQYWIIDKSIQALDKVEKKENVQGPFDYVQFYQRKKSLNIDTLSFTVALK